MRIVLMLLLGIFFSPAMSQVQEFNLKNGLKILVKEDHRAPVAVSMIWYNVGSADEPAGITGTSHALEHMMFKGSLNYPLGVFSKTIASLGGQENAFTYFDYTAYFEKIASTELPTAFALEADRMQNLLLTAEEFSKEIQVIKEERRLRTDNNPQALTFERYLSTAHLSPPYQHPIIGWMNDLNQMNIGDIKHWYQQYYAPNNAVLVVVGDVRAENVFQLAKHSFEPITKQAVYSRRALLEPPPLGQKSVEVTAPAKLPMLMFGYLVPSIITAHAPWEPYALELVAGILDAGESSRFTKNLIRGSHLASNLDVYYNPYSRYQTQFILFGTPSQTHTISELKQGMMREIDSLKHHLVSASELQRVKTQIIAQKTFEKDSIFGQALELGMLETVGAGWKTAEAYPDKIQNITPEQIKQVVLHYFRESAETEALLIPETKKEAA